MGPDELKEFEWDPDFRMGRESSAIAQRLWPPYLCEESDLPQPHLSFEMDAAQFERYFPVWGLREKNGGRLAAYINAVFLKGEPFAEALPEGGWQYAISAGAKGGVPNALCLVVANVDPSVQKRELSKLLLEKAKAEAKKAGMKVVIAPVRPSHRFERPDLSFEEYALLRRADGLFADPWLRAHERAGGVCLNICHSSAVVTATVGKWQSWTGQIYSRSGNYPLERGLADLEIDLEKNIGTYAEPNVWFRYRL